MHKPGTLVRVNPTKLEPGSATTAYGDFVGSVGEIMGCGCTPDDHSYKNALVHVYFHRKEAMVTKHASMYAYRLDIIWEPKNA